MINKKRAIVLFCGFSRFLSLEHPVQNEIKRRETRSGLLFANSGTALGMPRIGHVCIYDILFRKDVVVGSMP